MGYIGVYGVYRGIWFTDVLDERRFAYGSGAACFLMGLPDTESPISKRLTIVFRREDVRIVNSVAFFWWLNLVRLYSLYTILYPKRRI